jgi:hypothetical protein
MPQIKSKSAAVNTLPAPSYHTLPSGRRQGWRMPDLLSVITFDGLTPDPVTAAVIKLLVNEGSYVSEEDPRSFHHGVERIRGVYGIVAAGCVDPRFDPELVYGDGGALGRGQMWSTATTCFFVPALQARVAHLPIPMTLTGLRTLHAQAATYQGKTPAELMEINDPYAALVFNQACRLAGSYWPKDEDADDMSRFRTKGAIVGKR